MGLLDAKIVETTVTPDAKGYVVQLHISDAPPPVLQSDDGSPLPASSDILLVLSVRVQVDDPLAALAQFQWTATNDADSVLRIFLRDLGKILGKPST